TASRVAWLGKETGSLKLRGNLIQGVAIIFMHLRPPRWSRTRFWKHGKKAVVPSSSCKVGRAYCSAQDRVIDIEQIPTLRWVVDEVETRDVIRQINLTLSRSCVCTPPSDQRQHVSRLIDEHQTVRWGKLTYGTPDVPHVWSELGLAGIPARVPDDVSACNAEECDTSRDSGQRSRERGRIPHLGGCSARQSQRPRREGNAAQAQRPSDAAREAGGVGQYRRGHCKQEGQYRMNAQTGGPFRLGERNQAHQQSRNHEVGVEK